MRGLFWFTVWEIKVAVKAGGGQLIDCTTVMKHTGGASVQLALHFIKSWNTAHEMLLFIFRVSLSYLAKPFWK